MSRQFIDNDLSFKAAERTAVAIAVPVRNEATSIAACIGALDVAAAKVAGTSVTLVLLVNNSNDGSAEVARRFRVSSLHVNVVEVVLPPDHAHAGGARRAALEHAASLLPSDGVLMTTDADSFVDPYWIIANLAELHAGADAVAGTVTFDDKVIERLPPLAVRALEWRLSQLHARLGSLIDPRAHDPWPNHIWAWGASFALTVDAYRRVGGLPSIPLAEDRALADALERCDLRLRRSHRPVVFTSARRNGRAPGGFADLLHNYTIDPSSLCDAALEPTSKLVRRLCWRARLRRTFGRHGPQAAAVLARRLGYRGPTVDGFGALWSAVETESPQMARTRLSPGMLVDEVNRAERLISQLEQREVRRDDSQPSLFAVRPAMSRQPRSQQQPRYRSADSPASRRANAPA